jgi:outer membrane protein assembly complex protein YaeT
MGRGMTKLFFRIFCLFLLVVLLVQSLPGGAQDPTAPEPQLHLRSLEILGNSEISDKEIKKQLTIPVPVFWDHILPWKKLPKFKKTDLEADVERLKAYYRQQGFYHTKITTEIHENAEHRVDVKIIIGEGPWIVTKSITVWDGRTPNTPYAPLLQDRWPLNPGDRFNDPDYESLKALYLNDLFYHGHPRGDVIGKVYLDDKLNTADVVLTIDPGPLSFFGPTRVADSLETPDYVIKRKMAFKEGDIFDLRKIYESQKNLYKLDLFSTVAVTPEDVPADEAKIPIDVKVKEAKKRSVTAGLGWGSLDQFRANGGLRVRNLFGGGRLLDFHGQYSRINSEFDVTFTNPQIFASHYDLIISSGLFYRQYPSFYNKTISLQARLERDLPWNIKGYAGYLIQFDKPFNIPGTVEYVFYPVPQDQTFRTSEAFFGFRRNTTDDIAYPTQGSQQLLHYELAPTFLGSGYQYTAVRLEDRNYFDLWKKEIILATRAAVGLMGPIQGTHQIPLFRRYFTGGFNSVRGYRYYILGPTDIAGNPIGGQALLEGNVELRFPIYGNFLGVAFVDAGNVYYRIADLSPANVYYGTGFGVRYKSPVGPVGIDLAFPLRHIHQKQDPVAVYFTIGQTF